MTTAAAPAPDRVRSNKSVPAVTRAVAALRLLAASEVPLGVNAIASRLKVVPSTALHILRVLVQEELVSFDPDTKGYAIDAGILVLARSAMRPGNFGQPDPGFARQLARNTSRDDAGVARRPAWIT